MMIECDRCKGSGVSPHWHAVPPIRCAKCAGTGVIRHSDEDAEFMDAELEFDKPMAEGKSDGQ